MSKVFEMVLGGDTYRPALDMNAEILIGRESGRDVQALIRVLVDELSSNVQRVDAMRTLVWAMLATDCGRRKIPHPTITQVGSWFQEDPDAMGAQIKNFFGDADTDKFEGKVAPFVPTPMAVVRKMVAAAAIKQHDVVVDLGAGDGRLMLAAVDSEFCTAIGYELHPDRYKALLKTIEEHPKRAYFTLFSKDLMQADLSTADVVFLYLMPKANENLMPKLQKELRAGARVISHDFNMPGWIPEDEERIYADGKNHTIYTWVV